MSLTVSRSSTVTVTVVPTATTVVNGICMSRESAARKIDHIFVLFQSIQALQDTKALLTARNMVLQGQVDQLQLELSYHPWIETEIPQMVEDLFTQFREVRHAKKACEMSYGNTPFLTYPRLAQGGWFTEYIKIPDSIKQVVDGNKRIKATQAWMRLEDALKGLEKALDVARQKADARRTWSERFRISCRSTLASRFEKELSVLPSGVGLFSFTADDWSEIVNIAGQECVDQWQNLERDIASLKTQHIALRVIQEDLKDDEMNTKAYRLACLVEVFDPLIQQIDIVESQARHQRAVFSAFSKDIAWFKSLNIQSNLNVLLPLCDSICPRPKAKGWPARATLLDTLNTENELTYYTQLSTIVLNGMQKMLHSLYAIAEIKI